MDPQMYIQSEPILNSDNQTDEMGVELTLDDLNNLLLDINNLGVIGNVLNVYNSLYCYNNGWSLEFIVNAFGSSFCIKMNKINQFTAESKIKFTQDVSDPESKHIADGVYNDDNGSVLDCKINSEYSIQDRANTYSVLNTDDKKDFETVGFTIVDDASDLIVKNPSQKTSDRYESFYSSGKCYKCDYCELITKNKRKIRDHIKAKHFAIYASESRDDRKSNKGRKAKSKWLDEFLRTYNDKKISSSERKKSDKTYQCTFCNYTCSNQTDYYSHIGLNHAKVTRTTACEFCDFSCEKRKDLLKHVKIEHRTKGHYICNHCGFNAELGSSFYNHMKEVHERSLRFKCNHCEFESHRPVDLKKHITFKHTTKILVCGEEGCDFQTSSRVMFKTHQDEIHNSLKVFKCDQLECGFATSLAHVLKKHYYSVHGIGDPPVKRNKVVDRSEWFKCPYCNKVCSKRAILQKHIRIHHLGIRDTFTCSECDFKSSVKSYVDIHYREVHRGYYPYKCDECEYKSSVKARYEMHYKSVHLKQKPHKCPHCNHRGSQLVHIRRHIRDVHLKEKPNLCFYCEFCTANRGNLKAHLKTVHKVPEDQLNEVLKSCVNLRKTGEIIHTENCNKDEVLESSRNIQHINNSFQMATDMQSIM